MSSHDPGPGGPQPRPGRPEPLPRPTRDDRRGGSRERSRRRDHGGVWRRVSLGAVALASAVCLTVTGLGWTITQGLGNSISDLTLGGEVLDGAYDILLVGTDNRTDAEGNELSEREIDLLRAGDSEGGEGNTDTILLIRIPEDGSSATAISIPRDTYLTDPTIGPTKINGIFGRNREYALENAQAAGTSPAVAEAEAVQAGRNALIRAINDLTGVSVDHYAEIGLLGFVLMTDAVGGVPVCLNEAVDEPLSGAKFDAGEQTISGGDALSFVRQRHDLPAGDLDRIVRQQVFMSQLVQKVLSAGTLTDPGKLNKLTEAARRSFVIDDNWDFVDFALKLRDISGGNVQFETIPVQVIDGWTEYGESIVEVDKYAVRQFVSQYAGGDDEADATAESAQAPNTTGAEPTSEEVSTMPPGGVDPTAAGYVIEVVNTTDVQGFAASVQMSLTEVGFGEGDLLSDPGGAFSSHVLASTAEEDEARHVAELLGGLPVQFDEMIPPGTVRIVLAEDYSGPQYSLDPERAEAARAEAARQTAEETLPPEIAQRPTFDAGSDVPCVN